MALQLVLPLQTTTSRQQGDGAVVRKRECQFRRHPLHWTTVQMTRVFSSDITPTTDGREKPNFGWIPHLRAGTPSAIRGVRAQKRPAVSDKICRELKRSRWCGVVVREGGASSGVVHVTGSKSRQKPS
ncbi:hypothetical protein TNCV_2390821 [Trichonephila clavipes]|nr:hypothetical protein TNCV_2390821 [Trichonephila clavipes]